MIITLDEAKLYLNMTSTNSDTFLTAAIKESQSYIENNICQQPIEYATESIKFSGNGTKYQPMFNYPLVTITDLTESSDPLNSSLTTVLATKYTVILLDNLYSIYNENGFIKNNIYSANIGVGYISSEMPEDVKQVVKEMVYIYYYESNLKNNGRLGVSSLADSAIQSNVSTSFLDKKPDWKRRLQAYRKPSV